MNQQDSLANRFATPPRDVEWEELWGEQGPVDSVKALFPYSIAAVALTVLFLILNLPYFASFTTACIFLLLRLRLVLFQKARLSMNSLDSRDYTGIFLFVLPIMLAIWVFLGALLTAVFAADAGV